MTLQIYTGYAWRDMTDDEILIMNPENVVPFKTGIPEAGEIYWEGDEPPFSIEDYQDAKAQGLDLDDWDDYQQYCQIGPWEETE